MRMPLHSDLRAFVESLNATRVDYLIVGGLAVAWHGYPRFTSDIGIFIRPRLGNTNPDDVEELRKRNPASG
jgi:hypothetical protein